jgi:phytoene desaturase
MSSKKVLIIGTGLGGLSTALRLTTLGYQVEMVEQYHQPGGRLNKLEKDGFTFDIGPSFFSMSYEFNELAKYSGMKMPFEFQELNPLYAVNFSGTGKTYLIHKDINKLAEEFGTVEPDLKDKFERYLKSGAAIFHDTENRVIKQNFDSIPTYLKALASVPLKHVPKLFRTFWQELELYFESREVKEILSLVAFFLGGTPFDTPALYTLLSYTEFQHDGYYNVKGGMYKIVDGLVTELQQRGVKIHYGVTIIEPVIKGKHLVAFKDTNNTLWDADLFVANADAALFRGKVLSRKAYTPAKLDKRKWTMAPLTIYLGIKGKLPHVHHHNYFLGDNFKDYANGIFTNKVSLQKPYYYLNVLSRENPGCAPDGCEGLFILVPVPDLRYKKHWDDKDEIVDSILEDLSNRIDYNLKANTLSMTVMTPIDWERQFSLYRGSGLGLGHNLSQMGPLRPQNTDEVFKNLFYVGASTVPGTGLPMVVIGSKLTTEQITKRYGHI